MNALIAELTALLGDSAVVAGDVLSDQITSIWDTSPVAAKAIVKPGNTDDVSQVLSACHAANQSVVIAGGRTGLVGSLETRPDDILLSLERMNSIEEIDVFGRTATVQAGCILQKLQDEVASKGLFFAFDLGARGSCTVGGNAATNAGGLEVLRYGMMREQVLGLEAVLADGTVVTSMNRMLKNNSGFDLKQLFIGSEGLLGVVTRLVVRLHETCSSKCTALVASGSFESMVQLLRHCGSGLSGNLTRFELMAGNYYDYVTAPGLHRATAGSGPPVVCRDRVHRHKSGPG